MLETNIRVPWTELDEFARRNPIRKLAFFGSVLRDDFTCESDVDILVWLHHDARVGYFKLVAMEQELSELFGRKVDFRTPEELSRFLRDDVVAGCLVFYEEDAHVAAHQNGESADADRDHQPRHGRDARDLRRADDGGGG